MKCVSSRSPTFFLGGVWINAHWSTHIPLGHSEPTGWNEPGWLRMPKQICESIATKGFCTETTNFVSLWAFR